MRLLASLNHLWNFDQSQNSCAWKKCFGRFFLHCSIFELQIRLNRLENQETIIYHFQVRDLKNIDFYGHRKVKRGGVATFFFLKKIHKGMTLWLNSVNMEKAMDYCLYASESYGYDKQKDTLESFVRQFSMSLEQHEWTKSNFAIFSILHFFGLCISFISLRYLKNYSRYANFEGGIG